MPLILLIISSAIWIADIVCRPNVWKHSPPSERYRQKFMRDC